MDEQLDGGGGLATARTSEQLTTRRKKPKRPVPQRHQWFDAWRVAKGDSLKALVANTITSVRQTRGGHQGEAQGRGSRMTRRMTLSASRRSFVNLAHAALLPPLQAVLRCSSGTAARDVPGARQEADRLVPLRIKGGHPT